MSALMKNTAKQLATLGHFLRDWGIPAAILLVLALADGMVRTLALVAFGLVVASKLLILASDRLKQAAPTPGKSTGTTRRAAR